MGFPFLCLLAGDEDCVPADRGGVGGEGDIVVYVAFPQGGSENGFCAAFGGGGGEEDVDVSGGGAEEELV